MAVRIAFSCLLFILSLSFAAIVTSDDVDCVYTVYVKTGSMILAGTDSTISLTLYASDGFGIHIKNLTAWGGLMGSNHDYYERDNIDIFSGKGPCLYAPICAFNVTSDGTGAYHEWNCDYLEVTTTGLNMSCANTRFDVDQWLARNKPPYQLWAAKNNCSERLQQDHATRVVDGIRSGFSILRPTLTTV